MADGDTPAGGLAIDSSGTYLYGTASGISGWESSSTLFKLPTTPATPTNKFTVLYTFTDAGDGAFPLGDLVVDNIGNLFGTTAGSGVAAGGGGARRNAKGGGLSGGTVFQF